MQALPIARALVPQRRSDQSHQDHQNHPPRDRQGVVAVPAELVREVTIELRAVARVCVVSPDYFCRPLVVDRPLQEPSVVSDNLGT